MAMTERRRMSRMAVWRRILLWTRISLGLLYRTSQMSRKLNTNPNGGQRRAFQRWNWSKPWRKSSIFISIENMDFLKIITQSMMNDWWIRGHLWHLYFTLMSPFSTFIVYLGMFGPRQNRI
jgi:hypothetical protein